MNGATFWWLTYWTSILLVVLCDTFAGAVAGALCAGIAIAGFAIVEK